MSSYTISDQLPPAMETITISAPNSPTTLKQPIIEVIEEKTTPDAKILDDLSRTPYACSSIQRLSGGLANFTYRGQLLRPLPDGCRSVIIKHSEEYGSEVPDIKMSTTRSVAEQAVLHVMDSTSFPPTIHNNITIKPPRFFHFLPYSNTQIMEDISNSTTLREFLLSEVARNIQPSEATSLGQALAIWIASFHSWAPNQMAVDSDLARAIRQNEMVEGGMNGFLRRFLLDRCRDEKVRRYAQEELSYIGTGVKQGDFTTRNILIQSPSSTTTTNNVSLTTIDWEGCSYGHHIQDITDLLSDLYMQHHFNGSKSALPMLQGFVESYHPLSEDEAFQATVWMGIWFYIWEFYAPPTHTKEEVESLMRLAEYLIVKGTERDREWIEGSFLGCFFRGC